ncbi:MULTISPECIES: NADP-dependent oxidoreductase [unclassified Cellulophaga]|uniref:NADP-dependent oxidoreductase n=1 Tax=unclassified Cellulophaga TaxID=2634405 RepID=UPI0026E3A601|nr:MULTISPECIES: NADP-dependent oxidoreductase [unclassified Cellulophaga]MDO6489948.1 NADP-dependent oxidoreductase [Cellulophaga sp. 2_MG-2023]MDO6494858.1 NADP-dependent oxidoreductase [Cellulophaga sp. 3_MG-2023]
MKAVLLKQAGGPENLYVDNIDKPSIKENEVLVAVKAISLNPADVKPKYNDEMLGMMYGEERPIILGWDIAGTVTEVGTAVTNFKVGDNVFGMVNFPGVGNAYAEFVAAPETHLAVMPSNVSFTEAAATTLAALTALQILSGKINKGNKVLIQAGSGGVGHFAIQIAKAMGAYVITTASAKNKDFVMSIGADEAIDYHTQNFEDILTDIDFVLDTQGGKVLENSVDVLRNGGTVITTVAPDLSDKKKALAEKENKTVSNILVHSSDQDMNTLKGMLENGEIKPHIYKTFPFEKMADAHTEVEKGRTVGKVIVTL